MKTPKLHELLGIVHSRQQFSSAALGFCALAKWLVLLFLLVFAVDWLLRLPAAIRGVVLAFIIVHTLRQAWAFGWRRLRAFSEARVALTVEDHYSDLESVLVAGVQFQSQAPAGVSAAMAEHTIHRADEAAAALNPGDVVPFDCLRQPAVNAALLLGIIAIFALANSALLGAGLARVFAPWSDVAYPTRTQIALADSNIVVKEGDPLTLGATVSGEIPEFAKLAIRTGKGKPRARKLDIREGAVSYEMAGAFRSFDYAIRAGDADSGWQTVTVISAPRVAKTDIRLEFPAYMQRPAETMESMTLSVPEGASIAWQLLLDRPLSAAAFSVDGQPEQPLSISADGLSVSHQMSASASGAYAFVWTDKAHGYEFRSAKHFLQVVPDQAPQVELVSPGQNLFATLGRALSIEHRSRDDHGIGATRIIYRHNNAAEQTIPFAADWDYRQALTELAVGDSLTLAIEVSDHYPDGPHVVRSESRRISFLSREDYLAKIHERKDRLLSQVQGLYRQERAAYEVVRELDPHGEAFEQTCFLESSRQDILRERINGLSSGIRELIDDLRANNIDEPAEFAGLEQLQTRLASISEEPISQAGNQLRALGASTSRGIDDIAKTASVINQAARGLGSLVLQLGVREATEVFGRELHVIAQLQSEGAEQTMLADWIDSLVNELGANLRYDKNPLIVVRLSQLVKDLRRAEIATAMRAGGDRQEIAGRLFALESQIRAGAEQQALLAARKRFAAGITELQSADVAARLQVIQRDARLLILPEIPAPMAHFLAETPTEPPPVDSLLANLQAATDAAPAIATLETLVGIIDTRLAEIARTATAVGHSGAAAERAMIIRELLGSQMRLTEKTEDADYDETSAAYLAPGQLHLGKEVERMRERLIRKTKDPKLVAPLLKLLDEAAEAMTKASPALADNDLDLAIEHQDAVLDALEDATGFAKHESNGWLGLANLLMVTDGISLTAEFMQDIVAEQRDLIADTKASTTENRTLLLAAQKNLGAAVYQISDLLEGTGASLDFGQAMIFAGSDLGLSAQKLEADDVAGAMRAQRDAVRSVADLHRQFEVSAGQYRYFAAALEYLQGMHSEGVALQSKFDEERAKWFSDSLSLATGRDTYRYVEGPDDVAECLEEMRELMAHLAYIPEVEPIEASEAHGTMLAMVDTLLELKAQALAVYSGEEADLDDLEENLGDLLSDTREHKFIAAAQAHLGKALEQDGKAAYPELHLAGVKLQQCVLEYVLYYVEIKRSMGAKRRKKAKSGIVSIFKLSNKVLAAYDKDYGGVEGEDPQAARSEWEVLGRRDRAALNENFVRELPLEYRDFLKDYYERLTK